MIKFPSSNGSQPRLWRCLATLCAAILVVSSACANELVTIEGVQTDIKLRGISEEAVWFQPLVDGKDKVAQAFPVAFGQLVRWGQPAQRADRPTVILRQGSVVVTPPVWTREGPIELADGVLSIKRMKQTTLTAAKSAVRRIDFLAARDPEFFASAIHEADTHRDDDDRVWLASGDALAGEVERIGEGKLALRIGEELAEFELTQIVTVAMGAEDGDSLPPKFAVCLTDGSLLLVDSVEATAADFRATLTGDIVFERPGGDQIALLQPLSAGADYLSDLTPIDYRHTPQFELSWPLATDKNLLGDTLAVAGQRYLKGVAMHSASRVVYRVPEGAYKQFDAQVGVDDAAAPAGSVVFRVYLARNGELEGVYESPVVRRGDAPRDIAVDVKGASAVVLVVDHAGDGATGDHGVWLDARLVK